MPAKRGTVHTRDPAAASFDRTFLRPIAHRGLHNAAKGRIENTAPAFEAAIAKGYGIECDLRPASDGTPMVFHDATLDRLVAGTGPLRLRTPAGLARLRYRGQDTRILTFAQVLHLVNGRAPLLVEVKSDGRPRRRFLEKIAAEASAYAARHGGTIALMSFDRRIVEMLGELAPHLPRGWVVGRHQLIQRTSATTPAASSPTLTVPALLASAPPGLAFLAVDVAMLPEAAAWRAGQKSRPSLFSWTIRAAHDRATAKKFADAPIFEAYEP